MEAILTCAHLHIAYAGVPAVRDVSFSLAPGEILGIVGESGSGKSTLIRAATGLLNSEGQVTGGQILYRGRSLTGLSPKEMRQYSGPELGFIFQNAGASFCPVRTVGAQMYEAVRAHRKLSKREFREEALELLSRLGFPDGSRVLASYPFELSGGMQQRSGIAAAMLLRPSVLFADEPTSALDPIVQKQVVEQLLLTRQLFGTAIVLVSHNLGVIRAMADRILVLKDGVCVESGPCGEVLAAPRADYTRQLLAAVPRLKRE